MNIYMKNFKYLYLFIFLFVGIKGYGQTQVNTSVKKVYVIFKTHLDVGFTDLSSVVTDRYITEFIPKAIDVAEELEADGTMIVMYGLQAHGLVLEIPSQCSCKGCEKD